MKGAAVYLRKQVEKPRILQEAGTSWRLARRNILYRGFIQRKYLDVLPPSAGTDAAKNAEAVYVANVPAP